MVRLEMGAGWVTGPPVSSLPRAKGFLESPLGLGGAGEERTLVSSCRLYLPRLPVLGSGFANVFGLAGELGTGASLCSPEGGVWAVRAGGGGRAGPFVKLTLKPGENLSIWQRAVKRTKVHVL